MSTIHTINNLVGAPLVNDTPTAALPVETESAFGSVMAQTANVTPLTPSIAASLMHRSMTTGVPTHEFDTYGGYDAVKTEFEKNGGSYSLSDIPSEERHQLAQEVANTGIGNLSVLPIENIKLPVSALQAMADRGIDPALLNEIATRINADQTGQTLSLVTQPASVATETVTPTTAANLMARAMTTGVPTQELQKYGGYDAVKSVFEANGGVYNLNAISSDQRKQLAAQGISLANAQTTFVDSNSYIDSFMNSLGG